MGEILQCAATLGIPALVVVACVRSLRKRSRRSPVPEGLSFYPSTASGTFAPTPKPQWAHTREPDGDD